MSRRCGSCERKQAGRLGSTYQTALIFGEPVAGAETTRVKIMQAGFVGLRLGDRRYVTGDAVDQLVEDGVLARLGGTYPTAVPEGKVWYQVGSVGYLVFVGARVRSEETGEDIVERHVGE